MKSKRLVSRYQSRTVLASNRSLKSSKILQLVRPPIINPSKPASANLPVSLTPFIGRETEVRAIRQLLNQPDVRLVTLYGTAGLGKTRLSLEVGERVQNDFPDGVFFVNLATINKPDLGLAAIAQALGVPDQRNLPLLLALQNYLRRRATLLILDNFEQITELGLAVSQLLLAAPQLKVLVTSRAVLQLYGEHVYRVPPLALLEAGEGSFEALCQNEAISLFSQRAKMVNPQFELTEENAPTIAQLCIQLEGVPLAIELAAARCDLFSPLALLDKLGSGQRFKVLVGGFSNLPPRQQTLADALEWSYQLLNETEKKLFRRLGLFVGSFSLAALNVLGSDLDSSASVSAQLDTVISLLNKSLLKQVEAMPGEELRFTMLETIREYAWEKLVATGDLEQTRISYTRYFIEMVESGADQLQKPNYLSWVKRLEADHPNILSVLDYLIENQQVAEAFRLGGSIWALWWRWGYLNQGRNWLNKLLSLDRSKVEKTLQARVLDGAAYLAMHQNEGSSAAAFFEESLKIWREKGASKELGNALSGLAGTYRILGQYDRALQLNYETLELFRRLGDEANEADSLCNIAWQLLERGHNEPVETMLEQSLAIHTRRNYLAGVARAKIYLGDLLWRKNEAAQAIACLEEAIVMLRQVNHRIRLPSALYRLGLVYLCEGQLAQAEQVLEESVEISEELHKLLDLSYACSNLGLLRLVQNEPAQAELLFRRAVNLRGELGQLEGVLWGMEGLAVLALQQLNYEQAKALMEEAQLLREQTQAPILPHTLKFVLPVFLKYQSEAQVKAKSPVVSAAREFAVQPSLSTTTAPRLVSSVTDFGLEEAVTLSKREIEVLKLVAEGHRTSQIAQILVISVGTVNNHLNSIYSKLGVNSRTAAVRYALDHDLL